MKLFFFVLLVIALTLSLYAQETFIADDDIAWADFQFDQPEDQPPEEPAIEKSKDRPKKPFGFARQNIEFGFDTGAGIDNDLLKIGDILKKEIVIDLNKLNSDVSDSGLNINFVTASDLFLNIKNIKIIGSVWDLGFFAGVDGSVDFNAPKSIFTLITEGNIDQHYFEGMISASGGVFVNAGISSYAKFGKLRVGLKPALYVPLVYVPKSGINYSLDTEESISFSTSGEIRIYSPFIENGELKLDAFNFNELKYGVDLSVNGEYALFSFLDVGGSLSSIPLVSAEMENGLMFSLKMDEPFNLSIDDILNGNVEMPELKFDEGAPFTKKINVLRPLRLDVYVRYKLFSSEFLVLRPNVGFSVDINNEQGYFNAGLAVQLNLLFDLLKLNLSTNYTEAVWIHMLGLALNFRLFELDLSGSLRSESFLGSFQAQGFGLNLGLRFGW